jgi:hypothetical protein
MAIKYTSKELLAALRVKFPKAAVLSEVTMEDEEEAERMRTAHAARSKYYARKFKRRGQTVDAELPEDYDPYSAVIIRRIDALIFDGKVRTAVEIKISRADFFRETDAKRYAWRKHTHRFVYLTPKGLVKPEEVAEGCGLWEYDGTTVTVVKKATVNKEAVDLPVSMTKYFAWRAFAAERIIGKR